MGLHLLADSLLKISLQWGRIAFGCCSSCHGTNVVEAVAQELQKAGSEESSNGQTEKGMGTSCDVPEFESVDGISASNHCAVPFLSQCAR